MKQEAGSEWFVCGDSKRKGESKGHIEQEGPEVGYESKRKVDEKWNAKTAEEICDGVGKRQGEGAENQKPRQETYHKLHKFLYVYVLAYINIYLEVMCLGH